MSLKNNDTQIHIASSTHYDARCSLRILTVITISKCCCPTSTDSLILISTVEYVEYLFGRTTRCHQMSLCRWSYHTMSHLAASRTLSQRALHSDTEQALSFSGTVRRFTASR